MVCAHEVIWKAELEINNEDDSCWNVRKFFGVAAIDVSRISPFSPTLTIETSLCRGISGQGEPIEEYEDLHIFVYF